MRNNELFKLITNPSPAIKQRIKTIGVLSENQDSNYIERIEEMRIVRNCFQKIEKLSIDTASFHGFDGLESFIKILIEYGINKGESHLRKCISLIRDTSNDHVLFERGISKVGRILEDKGHSGSITIKASILANSGLSSEKIVKERINHSVNVFKSILQYGCIDDFSKEKKGKRVFNENILFPDYYNLRLLAFSDSWRTEENIETIKKAFERLIKFQPIPNIYIEYKGQLIAPGSYLMHEIDTDFKECNDDKKAEWLIRNEYLARMGILNRLRKAKKVKSNIKNIFQLVEVIDSIKKSYSFVKWGAYTGISLEENWKKKERKKNDVVFRLGLINYYLNNKSLFTKQ